MDLSDCDSLPSLHAILTAPEVRLPRLPPRPTVTLDQRRSPPPAGTQLRRPRHTTNPKAGVKARKRAVPKKQAKQAALASEALAGQRSIDSFFRSNIKASLTTERAAGLDLILQQGRNTFVTGGAGTGKTKFLQEVIMLLRDRYPDDDAIAVTAPTGLAANAIGGCTLSRWSGIHKPELGVAELVTRIRKLKRAPAWRSIRVLIIDEISMVGAELFDKLDEVGRTLRRVSQPFGGIQLVVGGDFCQLPPVVKGNAEIRYAFQAQGWSRTIRSIILLREVFRQEDPGRVYFPPLTQRVRLV